jgi:hypothetical protein
MIAFSDGNIHDIDHFLRVWTYAKTIGELEGLDEEKQIILEKKYGNTYGKHQEAEGAEMVRAFLADSGMSCEQIDRAAYLVGHHHTFSGIDGLDYQILVEADYIANASENGYSRANINNFMEKIMKTDSGKRLLTAVMGGI